MLTKRADYIKLGRLLERKKKQQQQTVCVAEGENGGSCIYWSARIARLRSLHTHTCVTPAPTARKAAVHRDFVILCVSSCSSAFISGVTAMVVYVHDWNFSTTDSSLSSSSINTDKALWGSTVSHSPGGLSRTGHTVVAVCLGFILVAGILSNFLTLLIFAKFRSLWTPINLILLNISLSDILVCVFGTPFSFAASLHGRWLIGEYGCKWYGFANSLFGE